ncbi:MAG: ABC transporter substrate-binding protein [Gammaproteobacteria bacterium]|nr:ABC transporter substrate-binding protein [Gammaproteobacteria bacterium]
MRRFLLTVAALMMAASAAQAEMKIGVLLGFTGPIESLAPNIAASAELAMQEATESGAFLGGRKVTPVRGDSTCIDAAAATAAAERLVNSDEVAAIMGADCSGVTTAVANNVAVPNGVVMISPSATSPALTTLDDNGHFFRTAPSDARQGQVLARVAKARGITNIGVTYTNNDYGKGLANAFANAFEAAGGTVALSVAHEDGKADYAAEVGALAASGAEHLAVFGYVDQGGRGIIQASLDTGAFDTFLLADGMIGDSLLEAIGDALEGSVGTAPGSDSPNAKKFQEAAEAAGLKGADPFSAEAYDAAALIILAAQAAGSTDRAAIQSKILEVSNAPGEPIGPTELAKGLELLAAGTAIDYQGATDVELTPEGDASSPYKEYEVMDGKFTTVRIH